MKVISTLLPILSILLAALVPVSHATAIIECDREAVLANNLFYLGDCSEVVANTYSNQCYGLGTLPGGEVESTDIAAAINSYLESESPTNSPLRGLGEAFAAGGLATNLNPFLVVGIARYESIFGTTGPGIDETRNSFSRTASPDEPFIEVNGVRWYKYASFEASLIGEDNQFTFLSSSYINRLNLSTLYDFVSAYAPDLDEAGRQNYVEILENTIDMIVDASDNPTVFGCVAASSSGSYEDNVAAGQRMAAARGWSGNEWTCLFQLWTRESGWLHNAINDSPAAWRNDSNAYKADVNRNHLLDEGETINEPTEVAYGIPQAKPGTRMAEIADDWVYNPVTQIEWGLGYIQGRYRTPCSAWSHSESHGWY